MIRVILTGGTIDKQYDEISGQLCFEQSRIRDMLRQARCTVPVTIELLMLKDSLDMQDTDRMAIKQACLKATEKHIIVVHGTDSMVETARFMAKGISEKTIVLFGAMVPYSFGYSDALFNLGSALCAVQLLENGTFITMNGKVFSWDNVQKNREKALFDTLS